MGRTRTEPGTVGANLKRLREQKEMTAERLEEPCGISHVTISRTETGHTEPRMPTIKKLARGLGVEPAELLKNESSVLAETNAQSSMPPGLDDFLKHRGMDVTRREELELKQMRIVLTRPVTPGLEFWERILQALRTLDRQADPA